ncbi:[NiFe]-hydrogenase assembly chaperone HybE [Azospirillum picis]|uniref:[NiFe] hydrogenase assembly HybE family chaperone n=1 Tax=Azospirillum picis TaxID=488438 RepID=A0ABU0MLG3_9PROT|nr:[NiFe]-hydrogenase assembly chaperone HybE [Azospirillum picis]MBP2301073.1 [NiFe] hydrogenase assembly HybE family chaperone [Azospirillum picis]MDQ0534307.1 [NiFe] hydrogenase assembly HybE family chaperone [Azospirillum picis]
MTDTVQAAVQGAVRFEGSYLGDAGRIAAATRMECKICWHVYDPAAGCEVWQIPAGTPFGLLPDHWRCPVCDGARDQFMVLDGGPAEAGKEMPAPATQGPRSLGSGLPEAKIRALEAAFREIHTAQMRGMPIVNDALAVKAVGFRPHDGRWLGALVTPWFLNLVLLPGEGDDWTDLVPGEKEMVEFPSGRYEFVHANRKTVGAYKACSLFSPMFDFGSMLQATETAAAAMVSLFDPSIREPSTREDGAGSPAAAAPAGPSSAKPSQAPAVAPPTRRTLLGLGAGRDA